MARDFRREILEATQQGDIGALANLAHVLLGHVEADDERRERQAEKKRKQRENRSVPGQVGTSGMSLNVPGRPGTNGDVPGGTHTQSVTTTHTPTAASQVIAKLGDDRLQQSLDLLIAAVGSGWEDVAGFLLRRKYSAWQAWADVMLREIGPGSQYVAADLVKVCGDDGTLDEKIKSAGIMRTFLNYARMDRVGDNSRSPPSSAARKGSTSRRDTKVTSGPALAPTTEPERIKWQT